MNISEILIVIPARYKSTRFPGKPLAKINGKSMLLHVWEKCVEAINEENVIVATDDKRIREHCEKQNVQVIMTSKKCLTGTDRIYEVANKKYAKTYINVQGDEPLIKSKDIRIIIDAAKKNPNKVINGMCSIKNNNDFLNPNIPKVVVSNDNRLLYISRAPIPTNKHHGFEKANKQVCIYAFPRSVLLNVFSKNNKTNLEKIEDIEILRFVELGYEVKMIEVSASSVAVDTPDDLDKVVSLLC